jgi:hypothetical protein
MLIDGVQLQLQSCATANFQVAHLDALSYHLRVLIQLVEVEARVLDIVWVWCLRVKDCSRSICCSVNRQVMTCGLRDEGMFKHLEVLVRCFTEINRVGWIS